MAEAIDFLGYSISMLMLLSGTALVVAEAFIPGAQFIVLGMALLITGLIAFATPVGASVPLLIATFVGVGVLVFLGYTRLDIYSGDGGAIGTSDSNDLIGVEGVVTEKVTSSKGKADLEVSGFSSVYQARTPYGEIEEGTRIQVTDGRGGSVVEVQSIAGLNEDEIDRELRREAEKESE